MEQADIPLPTCQKASSLCNLLRDPFFWNSYKMKSARTGAMTSFRVRWWECHQVDKTCHLPSYELKVEGQQVVKILWNALLEKLFLAMAALTKPRCEGSAFLVMGEKVEVWAIKEGKIEPDLSLPDLTAKLFPFYRSYEKLLGYQVLGPGQNDRVALSARHYRGVVWEKNSLVRKQRDPVEESLPDCLDFQKMDMKSFVQRPRSLTQMCASQHVVRAEPVNTTITIEKTAVLALCLPLLLLKGRCLPEE